MLYMCTHCSVYCRYTIHWATCSHTTPQCVSLPPCSYGSFLHTCVETATAGGTNLALIPQPERTCRDERGFEFTLSQTLTLPIASKHRPSGETCSFHRTNVGERPEPHRSQTDTPCTVHQDAGQRLIPTTCIQTQPSSTSGALTSSHAERVLAAAHCLSHATT